MQKILIRYAEIGLKGNNRVVFERQLISNIAQSVGVPKSQVDLQRKQLVLSVKPSLINQTIAKLKLVFGIAWFAPVTEVKSDLKLISSQAVKLAGLEEFTSFAIRASRADKSLAFTSQDMAVKVGSAVAVASGAKVDLKSPDLTVYISANKEKTLLYTQKLSGAGGLPVDSSGQVLSLLSGGFDSIVSSYLMAKRGAKVDYLHFHVFPSSDRVLKSKIKTIVDKLSASTLSQRLFLASYTPFQMAVLDLANRQQKHELVVFRRLMVKVGEKLALKHNYQALVLGDSLGQVASQIMENIVAVDSSVDLPIFRPLIGMDKVDIIDLVKDIGLEPAAVEKYKDCCSIVSKTPATRGNLNKVKSIEDNINISKVIDEIINQIQIINL